MRFENRDQVSTLMMLIRCPEFRRCILARAQGNEECYIVDADAAEFPLIMSICECIQKGLSDMVAGGGNFTHFVQLLATNQQYAMRFHISPNLVGGCKEHIRHGSKLKVELINISILMVRQLLWRNS